MNNETYIRWLPGTGKGDGENIGTKAANLGEMMRLGIPVPVGFCVTGRAYLDFIQANRLDEQIPQVQASAQGDNFAAMESMTRQIRDIISNGAVPTGIYREVSNAYGMLSTSRVAVRSSAQEEDLLQSSFAGQYETYLNIVGLELLWQHIKKCWASQWTVQAAYYRKHRDFHQNGHAFAVVIQEMIAAEVSGVLFTVNPVSGTRDEALISAYWGLGEPIVKGSTIPDEFWLDKNRRVIRKKRIAIKEKMVTAAEEGGTAEVDVPMRKQKSPCLTGSQVRSLV